MPHALHLILRNLVGDNRQPFIQLHRIPIDDFAIVLPRYLDSQLPGVMSDGRCASRIYLHQTFPSPSHPL
jgi:hypothetical protein